MPVAEHDLDAAVRDAVVRSCRLLGARPVPSRRLPVVLDPLVTRSFLGICASAFDGEAVLKGRSMFADRLGATVAAPIFRDFMKEALKAPEQAKGVVLDGVVRTVPQAEGLSAVLAELGRQPRAAHEFFVKHQDRVLMGKDTWEPSEYHYYFRVFETSDEYFDYYRKRHAFWKMYGMGLPDEVLKKVYYKNAVKVFKGMPATGWPQ